MVNKFLLYLVVMTSWTAAASSWEECQYKFRIESKTEEKVTLGKIRVLGGDGSGGSFNEKVCIAHLKDKEIKIKEISEGKELVLVGSDVKAKRNFYSGMGPTGSVGGVSWEVFSLDKDK